MELSCVTSSNSSNVSTISMWLCVSVINGICTTRVKTSALKPVVWGATSVWFIMQNIWITSSTLHNKTSPALTQMESDFTCYATVNNWNLLNTLCIHFARCIVCCQNVSNSDRSIAEVIGIYTKSLSFLIKNVLRKTTWCTLPKSVPC